jgi:hypothetical protein
MALFNKGLGRRHATDPRDFLFQLDQPEALIPAKKTWATGGKVWDQKNTPHCVSYSANKLLTASPVRNKPWAAGLEAFYKECQRNDEFPGEDYDGTSVRAAMKVFQAAGLISEYRWGHSVPPISNHIASVGPVQAGTDWTAPMFDPVKSRAGVFVQVSPDGKYDVAGGHAYLLIGTDTAKKCPDGTTGAFLILNSWSESWGHLGTAWISFKDFAILLNNQGEAAVAIELKR